MCAAMSVDIRTQINSAGKMETSPTESRKTYTLPSKYRLSKVVLAKSLPREEALQKQDFTVILSC